MYRIPNSVDTLLTDKHFKIFTTITIISGMFMFIWNFGDAQPTMPQVMMKFFKYPSRRMNYISQHLMDLSVSHMHSLKRGS